MAGVSAHPTRRRGAAGAQLRDEAVELVVARLRAIADPNRIRLLGMLNEHDASVTELADRMATTSGCSTKRGSSPAPERETACATRSWTGPAGG